MTWHQGFVWLATVEAYHQKEPLYLYHPGTHNTFRFSPANASKADTPHGWNKRLFEGKSAYTQHKRDRISQKLMNFSELRTDLF